MIIGPYHLPLAIALSPMTGITDKPFRKICRQFGATWTVGEMVSGDPALRHTHKSSHRINHQGEHYPIVMQIVGNDPKKLAAAAQYHVAMGADVIDINMGCPAKKVCHSYAGSALMQDEKLVEAILSAVVTAVAVPVTLKTRLGWDDGHLNILTIARIAEKCGIAALAIHGRSRTQMYQGTATYELIAKVKQQVSLPIWANGDINSGEKAAQVLALTNSDGVMVGRASQGRPWIFREISQYLTSGATKEILSFELISATIKEHLQEMYLFYGAEYGYRIARKHIGWYLNGLTQNNNVRQAIYVLDNATLQYEAVCEFLAQSQVAEFYYKNSKSIVVDERKA